MKLDSKYFDKIRTRRKKATPKPENDAPICQWDGCEQKGAHRAPVGRDAEGQYFMFCFEHVQKYNKGYNYFSGLSDKEIARYQKEAITGNRPTWTVGVNKAGKEVPIGTKSNVRDPFGFVEQASPERKPRRGPVRKLKPLEVKAFQTLELEHNASSDDIKTSYKSLVKQHHPDSNGGDRGSEERFRAVVQAYQLLKQSGYC